MTKEERAAYWRQQVDLHRASGLSVKAYCAQEGLAVATLHYWRKRFGMSRQAMAAVPGEDFVPIHVAPRSPVERNSTVEVHLLSGRRLQLNGWIDSSWLQTLVQVLEGPCG
ncbi:MAG: IS66 family insertion sequence element accessory protein TnpB [Acidithiobacillus sp.]|nr:IS66 family insertion sequence element accessory protein TnpB [Acidithiobacillus sp.]